MSGPIALNSGSMVEAGSVGSAKWQAEPATFKRRICKATGDLRRGVEPLGTVWIVARVPSGMALRDPFEGELMRRREFIAGIGSRRHHRSPAMAKMPAGHDS
jgi:hypothetical protein